jgi:hypothetical protein
MLNLIRDETGESRKSSDLREKKAIRSSKNASAFFDMIIPVILVIARK